MGYGPFAMRHLIVTVCHELIPMQGGMFLDNIVTIFDYDDRRVGFADISDSSVEDGR